MLKISSALFLKRSFSFGFINFMATEFSSSKFRRFWMHQNLNGRFYLENRYLQGFCFFHSHRKPKFEFPSFSTIFKLVIWVESKFCLFFSQRIHVHRSVLLVSKITVFVKIYPNFSLKKWDTLFGYKIQFKNISTK